MPIENRNLEPSWWPTTRRRPTTRWWWPAPRERCSTSFRPTMAGSSRALLPWEVRSLARPATAGLSGRWIPAILKWKHRPTMPRSHRQKSRLGRKKQNQRRLLKPKMPVARSIPGRFDRAAWHPWLPPGAQPAGCPRRRGETLLRCLPGQLHSPGRPATGHLPPGALAQRRQPRVSRLEALPHPSRDLEQTRQLGLLFSLLLPFTIVPCQQRYRKMKIG